ncbi:MAG: hypothetical protein Q4A74_04735 [Cardiobacteriaceae bacterium]|nr:hypothetical protein [Cardiobacteriaceae bacterium]
MSYQTKSQPLNLRMYSPDIFQLRNTMLCFLVIAFLFWLPDAMAAGTATLPTTNISIPGVDSGEKNWLKQFSGVISFVIVLITLAGLGFGLSDAILSLFHTINDARQNDSWGPALKLIGLIIAVIVFCLVLYYLINTIVLEPLSKVFG